MSEDIKLTPDGGVVKRILNPSKFDELPQQGHEVEVHYTGKLDSGSVFDSSRLRNSTFKFVLGEGSVIKGWEIGVASMNIGESALLIIQPDYGYGAAGSGTSIPPNATLHFEIELINSRPKPKPKWDMSVEEKIQAAADAKAEGNAKFTTGRIHAAISYYEDGVRYLATRDDWSKEAREASDVTKLQCHLNLANCYLKTEDFVNAEVNASEALAFDPNNVKGLYRHGLALMGVGSFKEAVEQFQKLLKLEPTNASAHAQLKAAKLKLSALTKRERNMFGHVFKSASLYNEKVGPRDVKALPKVFLDINIQGHAEPTLRLVIALYVDTVPKTAENFQALCDPEAKLTFKGSRFHRLIKGFMIQGGDITNGDGTGGVSIYGDTFSDEAFVDVHSQRGLVSMANCGPNTNNSQFFITFAPATHLDGKHVVFGEVVQGLEILDTLEALDTNDKDEPLVAVTVAHCGTL